ncbi:hypothetical protein [Ornithinimicrobium kibberense]|uniref:hypothetical protein n=1 Tax=Ornithinimicrobium kibberense TaxID=282060 RepID=UPI00361FABFE
MVLLEQLGPVDLDLLLHEAGDPQRPGRRVDPGHPQGGVDAVELLRRGDERALALHGRERGSRDLHPTDGDRQAQRAHGRPRRTSRAGQRLARHDPQDAQHAHPAGGEDDLAASRHRSRLPRLLQDGPQPSQPRDEHRGPDRQPGERRPQIGRHGARPGQHGAQAQRPDEEEEADGQGARRPAQDSHEGGHDDQDEPHPDPQGDLVGGAERRDRPVLEPGGGAVDERARHREQRGGGPRRPQQPHGDPGPQLGHPERGCPRGDTDEGGPALLLDAHAPSLTSPPGRNPTTTTPSTVRSAPAPGRSRRSGCSPG